MNEKYIKELSIFLENHDISFLENKSIMITGASGLIGSYLIDILMHYNKVKDGNIKIHAIVRNLDKAKERFKESKSSLLHLIKQDISLPNNFDFPVDFIIHAASNANPVAFSTDPIGTIKANVNGTMYLLEYAEEYNVQKFLYLSSSEIYGEPIEPNTIYTEGKMGIIDPMNPRACYTESKRMAENILVNYSKQYGVPINIARIGFAYGPTFTDSDNRVIPQFVRNAIKNEPIILKSTGSLVRSYIYMYDVSSGIFKILSEGKIGEAYNIANSESNVSIKEIAETVAQKSSVDLIFDLPKEEKEKGYAPFSMGLIDAKKLEGLGWKPVFDIEMGIGSIIETYKK